MENVFQITLVIFLVRLAQNSKTPINAHHVLMVNSLILKVNAKNAMKFVANALSRKINVLNVPKVIIMMLKIKDVS